MNCQMLFSASPMKRTWMVASSERTWKVQLASEPSAWGTSRQTLRCTQPFTPFAAILGFAGALGRRLIAPLGPLLHCPLPGATTVIQWLLPPERQWKEKVDRMDWYVRTKRKRKEDECMEAGTTQGGAVEAGPDPFDVGQVGDQAKRQHTDIASPCMNDEPAAWSVPEGGGGGDMTTESAAMVCPPPPLPRTTSGSNGTTLTGCLRFPFTYVANPALRGVAKRGTSRPINKQKLASNCASKTHPSSPTSTALAITCPTKPFRLTVCSYMRILVLSTDREHRGH